MIPNDIFILGGGASVRYLGGIDMGLFKFLQDKFCIGINYSYKFVNTTCNLGVDETLYNDSVHHEEINQLPLWIGKDHKQLKHKELNTIFLKPSKRYDRDLKEGVYRASLSGIFALSLTIKILDETNYPTRIWLIGYDGGPLVQDGKVLLDSQNRPLTHWYQEEFEHRGTGKVSWYQQTGFDQSLGKRVPYFSLEYQPFVSETKVKIYNVGGTSKIPHFEHISYEELFTKKLIPGHYDAVNNQANLRTELREILWKIKKENNI